MQTNSSAGIKHAIAAAFRVQATLFALMLLCILPMLAHATQKTGDTPDNLSVFVAGSENMAFNLLFRERLLEQLPENIHLETFSPAASADRPGQLVISLGPSALNEVMQQAERPPLLALMITESQFSQYQNMEGKPLAARYLNPPLLRQALLGRAILPHASRISVLARAGSEQVYKPLAETLNDFGLELRVFTVENSESLVSTLTRALNYGDFLLGTPDPAIYNRQTIKHILLTTYRYNRILIGPERAFVQAGALASTFTPTEALIQNVDDEIARYFSSGTLGASEYPTDFSILFNFQVARSLNIPLPDPTAVETALKEQEATMSRSGNE
ncbi:ABC transporter substrate-binding protein [Marinobacter sp. 1Y8]